MKSLLGKLRISGYCLVSFLLFLLLAAMAPAVAEAATLAVSTTADTVADDGVCSLREAVSAVNNAAASGALLGECIAGDGAGDTINLPAGTYTLAIPGVNEDLNATGDLDIAKAVTIQGAGAGSTTINGNGAVTGDRVIHMFSGTSTIDGVTITGGLNASLGGGVEVNNSATAFITNSTISGNTAGQAGGGLHNGIKTVTITNSTISGNTAGEGGGGLFNNGTLIITGSTISGNTAVLVGGGLGNEYARLTITNSTISGNTSSGGGGGLYSFGDVTITNTTISSNTAVTYGGGLYNFGSTTITNSTISGNTGKFGGGVSNSAGISITNSIIAGQNAGSDCYGKPSASNGYNIDSDGSCGLVGAGDISASATITGSLGALANNGGPTQTHALLAGSPAIDKGSCVQATDQRGISRPRDGNGDKLARCDIGAYEYGANAASTLSMTISGTGTVSDGIGALSLMNACSAGTCTEQYDSAATISLTATPTAPAFFFGWSGSVSGTANPLSIAMSANKTITATLGAEGLIVTVTGPGTVSGTTAIGAAIDCPTTNCGAVVTPGTLYNMTATPTGAAVFSGWTITSAEPTGTTCAGALTPCNVATSTTAGVVTYATARFDLYGCTSLTATNYNPSATINDGSCVFPAPTGGGGGSGGGLENQPPYFPGGGSWLISPEDKANGNGDTPFVWKILTDLDGDIVTYYLFACSGADLADCKVIDMVIGNGDPHHRYAYGLGVSGAALLLTGFVFTHGGRRRLLVLLAAISLTSSASLIACGADGGSGNGGVIVSACSEVGADSICREKFNLAPGDYQWKVTADDGRGGQIESEARSFTVK